MKRTLITLAAGLVMVCGWASLAETIDTHKSFRPQEIKWGPGPAGLPAGAESAVLFGDPKGAGMFALRLKMPKGYSIAPHMHVGPEIVTVISGKFSLGLGQAADHAGMEVLPAGSFSSMPKGVVHYLFVDKESVHSDQRRGALGYRLREIPRTILASMGRLKPQSRSSIPPSSGDLGVASKRRTGTLRGRERHTD